MRIFLLVILVCLGFWCGWLVSSVAIKTFKETGGIVFASDIIKLRLIFSFLGAFVGGFIAVLFIKQFNN